MNDKIFEQLLKNNYLYSPDEVAEALIEMIQTGESGDVVLVRKHKPLMKVPQQYGPDFEW